MLTAPMAVRSPVICLIPSKEIPPTTFGEISMEPVKVLQVDAMAVASA
jgi:hypothetical protein